MTKKINDIPVYATVEDANTFFEYKYGSNWSEIAQTDKEKLLITATKEIENTHFCGLVLDQDQELLFPRVICGETIAVDDTNLIACCCEIANAIYNTNISNIITPNADKIQSMSVGDTSITYKDGATVETDVYNAVSLPIIKKYLGDILRGNIRILL